MSSSDSRAAVEPIESNAGDLRRLTALLEMSQALLKEPRLKTGLAEILAILARHQGALRGFVAFVDRRNGEIAIDASVGPTEAGRRVRRHLGEHVERVVRSGKPVVVPQTSREPGFSDTGTRASGSKHQELSHLCVPISLEGRAVGALGIDVPFSPGRD